MTPLDVLLLSYIKGCFVYCPFLLVQFKITVFFVIGEESQRIVFTAAI